MLIGIDARFAVRKRRGIGNYTLRLISNLSKIDTNKKFILYTDREDSENTLPQKSNFRTKRISPSNYFLWEQIALPLHAHKDKVDILHCTGNTAPIYVSSKTSLAITIHDVMFLKDYSQLPKSTSLYQQLGRIYRKFIVPKSAKNARRIITVSQFSKNDIIKYLTKISEDMIDVTYEAADESFGASGDKLTNNDSMYNIPEDYILTLGGTDPRKNTEFIIRKFIELKNEYKINKKLVIIGIPNWKQSSFSNLVQNSCYKNDIIFTEFISDDELIALYKNASVFLYPSLYEGFGIPLLEAMSSGSPVITSNVTSMPEIAGDAALYINPTNGQELKDAIMKLTNNENVRNKLIANGFNQVKNFSWMKMAEDTIAIYEKVCKERFTYNSL